MKLSIRMDIRDFLSAAAKMSLEDEETLISYKFYLRGLQTFEEDGILYVLAEEVAR